MIVTSTGTKAEELLRTADAIGQRISQEAVWHNNHCNWLGAEPLERAPVGLQSGVTHRSLSPDLYSGTSGVGLFLAELYGVTGDIVARRTALGAIRQALSRVDAVPSFARLGLFTGWIGIAFAAVCVGMVLGEAELLERALQLLQRSALEQYDDREFDLMSGRAGAIATLVVLHHILHDPFLLGFAMRLGDELLHTVDNTGEGYSWESPGLRNQRNLTGFSHGAAGAGYALLELFHATGDSKYCEAAMLAFQYERHWFDPDIGNWPDFREDPFSRYRSKHPLSFATFWCHGAPGIALSRLRAYEILHDEICKAEAIIALETTQKAVETMLYAGMENFSLCHGLVGNAEVLLYGGRVLGQDSAHLPKSILDVAQAGIDRYAATNRSWPCGTHSGETPNLMLGLAGIGYFYLRLYNPAIPSILILRGSSELS
jgi:lantibiotic biosynthesis protein